MSKSERVTITLPADVLHDIDLIESNRSRFVLSAVRHELERHRREALRRSLTAPHEETDSLVELGFSGWAQNLPEDPASDIVDLSAGTAVSWLPGQGWVTPP